MGGIVIENGGDDSEGGRAVIVADGGIVYVGGRTIDTGTNHFIIQKFFADGSLDTSFHTDGIGIYRMIGAANDWIHGLVLQTDGKILIGGRTDMSVANAHDFAVLRITSQGNYDTTFSTNGRINVGVTAAGADIGRGIALQTNGHIVIAGYGKNADYDFAFCRLRTDGELDTSFATSGKKTVANGTSDDGALSVAIDSNGSIVGAGNSYNGANWDFAAVRLLDDGALDTSFNTSGKTTITLNTASESAYSVAINNVNQAVLAGGTNNGTNLDFGFIRLLTEGRLDTSFATSGKKTLAILSNDEAAHGVKLETSGNVILASGYSNNSSNNDFTVVRLLSDGTLDSSFATDGSLVQIIGTGEDTAQGIAMKGDGMIVAAGRTEVGSAVFDLVYVRLDSAGSLTPAGSLVQSFGTGGRLRVDNAATPDRFLNVVGDTSGKLYATGKTNNGGDNFLIVRVNPSGTLDTTFSTSGKKEVDGGGADLGLSVKTQTDGKVVLAGYINTTGVKFGVLRFETSGSLDSSFNTTGKLALAFGTVATTVSILTSGSYLLMGQDTAGLDFGFAQLLADGTYDTSFNTIGNRVIDIATSNDYFATGFVDGNGSVVGVGVDNSSSNFAVVRMTISGSLDTSFNTTGKYDARSPGGWDSDNIDTLAGVNQSFGGALVPGNRIAVYTYVTTNGLGEYYGNLTRLTTSGNVDTSFHTDGANTNGVTYTAAAQFNGLTVAPSGKIFTAHSNFNPGASANTYVVERFKTNGAIDTTFNTSGILSFGIGTNVMGLGGLTIMENGWVCGSGAAGRGVATDASLYCVWQ